MTEESESTINDKLFMYGTEAPEANVESMFIYFLSTSTGGI